jgi:hypothetical protein
LVFGFWLFVLGVIVVIGIFSKPKKPTSYTDDSAWDAQAHNQQWMRFIEGYDVVAKTEAEKQLLRRMLYDAVRQGSGFSSLADEYKDKVKTPPVVAAAIAADPALQAEADAAPAQQARYQPGILTKERDTEPIDNATLLLYFGAFLFVASVGLFISFGGANGAVRTFAALFVMLMMYGSGLWLFKNKPKQQQAGITFAAVGIVIAPLVGLASYTYLFDKQHGPVVWLLTSLFCLALYLHALFALRKPLIAYLLIFTFLSLFESGVSVVDAPVYYFGWGLAFVGILLQFLSRWKGNLLEIQDASSQSGKVMIPVAVFTSIAMVSSQGSLQLGISLLLASAYYALEAMHTKYGEQQTDAVVSQVTAIAAAYCLAYPVWKDWTAVALVVLVVNLVQLVAIVFSKSISQLWYNFATVLVASMMIGVLPLIENPKLVLVALAGLIVSGAVVFWRQKRADAYAIGTLALVAVPVIYGQIAREPSLDAETQAFACFSALLVVLALFMGLFKAANKIKDWLIYAEMSYLVGATITALAAFFVSPMLCLALCVGVAATFVLIAEHGKQHEWTDAVGILLAVPVVRSWDGQPELLISISGALVILIAMSLRYRGEFLRWSSTVAWLLLPFGLEGVFSKHWGAEGYAWSYLGVMFALLLSRAIARGVLFFSGNTPLAAYTRSASLSYVFGYITAAVLAVLVSLFTDDSQLITSLMLGILFLTVLFVSLRVEKRKDILALLPVLSQALLLSSIRPAAGGPELTGYLLASTALAAGTYAVTLGVESRINRSTRTLGTRYYLGMPALATAFITPVAVVFVEKSVWPMALGLLVAGSLLSYDLRVAKQAEREMAGAVITASILWFMAIFHVDEFQAYVHVIVANLALYAYWRSIRGERAIADQYLWWMLGVATVPLALQAMGGTAGSFYGWLLLLEQVAFMLLGMIIRRSFVTRWGLYVAVAAVLYQLRHLGWAALTVLAVFLIGIAMYQLQKHSDQK